MPRNRRQPRQKRRRGPRGQAAEGGNNPSNKVGYNALANHAIPKTICPKDLVVHFQQWINAYVPSGSNGYNYLFSATGFGQHNTTLTDWTDPFLAAMDGNMRQYFRYFEHLELKVAFYPAQQIGAQWTSLPPTVSVISSLPPAALSLPESFDSFSGAVVHSPVQAWQRSLKPSQFAKSWGIPYKLDTASPANLYDNYTKPIYLYVYFPGRWGAAVASDSSYGSFKIYGTIRMSERVG